MKNKKKKKSFFFLEKLEKEKNKRWALQKKGSRDKEPNLMGVSTALDSFIILEKMKLFCAYLYYKIMVHQAVIKYDETDFKLMPAIFELLKSRNDWHPIILIYWKLVCLFENLLSNEETPNAFFEIETLLSKYEQQIIRTELIEIYSNLTNYATYQINNGEQDFIIKCIEYNQKKIQLEQETDENFVIDVGTYKNIVTLILWLDTSKDKTQYLSFLPEGAKDFNDWALLFAENYATFLSPSKKNYYHYAKGLVLFRAKKYEKAYQEIKDLSRVREMFISLDIKVLQLQLLLELGLKENEMLYDADKMNSEIDKLRSLLSYDKNKKNKLTYHKDYFWQFLNLYRKFYHFFLNYNLVYTRGDTIFMKKKNEFITAASTCKYSYGKWFLEKLEQIK